MVNTSYISRVFPLDAAAAIAATEAWHCDLASAGARRLVAGHRLRLRHRFEPTDFDPLLLRRLRGTLWVGGWPVAVELELVRYSRYASKIALRPSGLRWPVLTERYEYTAARAVAEVVDSIMAAAKCLAEQSIERTADSTELVRRFVEGDPGTNGQCGSPAPHLPGSSQLLEFNGLGRQVLGNERAVEHIVSFLGTVTADPDNEDRVLASVVFTDVVVSTPKFGGDGDRRWSELLDLHDRVTERLVTRFWGRLVNRMGDAVRGHLRLPSARCSVR